MSEFPSHRNSPWVRDSLMQAKTSWCYELGPIEINEVEDALNDLMSLHKPPLQCHPDDFPLPYLDKILKRALTECEFHSGVFLLRGLPVHNKTKRQARWLGWGIGLHLGVPLAQNQKGELLVDVLDKKQQQSQPMRGHRNNCEMEFHVDSCDLVTLLCLSKAAKGGCSKVASSLNIYHWLATHCPSAIEILSTFLPFLNVSATPLSSGFFMCPVFAHSQGAFTCRFYRKRILASQNLIDAPRLSPSALQALEKFHEQACMPESYIEIDLKPGDLQFLNNHVVCHARTQFQDGDTPDQQRHLLRQWFATACSRPLPVALGPAYGSIEAGTLRGGYQGWAVIPEIESFQASLARANRLNHQPLPVGNHP